jgi:hypothetical protein
LTLSLGKGVVQGCRRRGASSGTDNIQGRLSILGWCIGRLARFVHPRQDPKAAIIDETIGGVS